MDDDRKKRGWVYWISVILLIPALYVASFGPACWWFSTMHSVLGRPFPGEAAVPVENLYPPRFYWPIGWLAARGPTPIRRLIHYYGTALNHDVFIPTAWDPVEWKPTADDWLQY